jgi:glycosyltransferase involved in cell wall biosynthesis
VVKQGAQHSLRRMTHAISEKPLVSVIIAACNESAFIEETVRSVLNQSEDSFDLELLVIDNGSTDSTPEIVSLLATEDRRVKLLCDNSKSTPAAFNTGLRAAQGGYVAILGAHALYPPQYISVCLRELERHDAVGCSGKILTIAANDSWQARVCAWAMGHPFCSSGNSVRTQREGFVDTIPFPVMRKANLVDVGGYDETLLRNQDNDMNQRLRARGYKLFLTEKVHCLYYASSSLAELGKWGYRCGRWNAVSLRRNPNSLRPRHLVPLMFVLSILSLTSVFFAALVSDWSRVIPVGLLLGCLALGSHLLLGTIAAAQVSEREKSLLGLCLPLVILGFHLVYGWGTLIGMVALRPHSPNASLKHRGMAHEPTGTSNL